MESYRIMLLYSLCALSISVSNCLHTKVLPNAEADIDPVDLFGRMFSASISEKAQRPEKELSLPLVIKKLEDTLRRRGQELGVPPQFLTENMSSWFGDGTHDSIRAMARNRFQSTAVSRANAALIDFAVDKLGTTHGNTDPVSMLRDFDTLTTQMGSKGFASTLAPLLKSSSPPTSKIMLDFAGQLMAKNGMPAPILDFVHGLGELYKDDKTEPHSEAFWRLVNKTNQRIATMFKIMPKSKKRHCERDMYKKTMNHAKIKFAMPCKGTAPICYSLDLLLYINKNGPGTFQGTYGNGPPGTADPAFQLGIMTREAKLGVPFFYGPSSHAAGIETEYNLERPIVWHERLESHIIAEVKVKDSVFPTCFSTGQGAPDDPHLLGCHLFYMELFGPYPDDNFHLGINIHGSLQQGPYHSMFFTDALKWGGPLGEHINHPPEPWVTHLFDRIAHTGFYKNLDYKQGYW